eukprot:GEMP01063058.1.p1 GENE.GEMP01063058.1~~GEMP01063058.1.p1  ORF type:complete len:199 (+),score=34.51 GEMP01063058.1:335-931(+)
MNNAGRFIYIKREEKLWITPRKTRAATRTKRRALCQTPGMLRLISRRPSSTVSAFIYACRWQFLHKNMVIRSRPCCASEFATALVRRLEPYYEGQSEERLMVAETLVRLLDLVPDYQSQIVPLLAEAVEIDFDVADVACERALSLTVFRDWALEHIRRKRLVDFNPSLEPDLPMPTLPRASKVYIGHDGLLVSESVSR